MTCGSCGGIIGRDCFNPEECAVITQSMNAASQYEPELHHLRRELAAAKDELVAAGYGEVQATEQLALASERIEKALEVVQRYGGTDGAHHKQCVLDQVVRFLAAHDYDAWLADYCAGEDGPDTYSWDEGIAP